MYCRNYLAAAIALFLFGCDQPDVSESLIDPALSEIRLSSPLRNIRSIDPARTTIAVRINDNDPINAIRSGTEWVVSGLNRAEYAVSNSVEITWTEQIDGQALLLAEYSGDFTLTESRVVTLEGSFKVDDAARFDVDGDGVPNLSERASDPPSDPYLMSSVPLPPMESIPAGCFDMGSPDNELGHAVDEGPVFNVCVDAFQMGKHEVTYAQYDAFAFDTARRFPNDLNNGRGTRPVTLVTAEDALAYAAWLSLKTGERYRLPTEVEWEFAARSGTTTPFNTGPTITTDQANFDGTRGYNNAPSGVSIGQAISVGSYPPNNFGLYDTHGNVSEMVCSVYSASYNGAEQECATSFSRGLSTRGGFYSGSPIGARSAERAPQVAGHSSGLVGFRLVQE